jgi:hypothetical protein
MSNTDELQGEILPPCCNLSAAAVERYSAEGLSLIHSFLPDARTVLVLGHHIRASLEWAWFPLAAERGGNTCAADLHAKSVMEAIERQLMLSGHKSPGSPNRCARRRWEMGAERNLHSLWQVYGGLPRQGIVGWQPRSAGMRAVPTGASRQPQDQGRVSIQVRGLCSCVSGGRSTARNRDSGQGHSQPGRAPDRR